LPAVANARAVLAACLDEAALLATPSGRISVDGEKYVSAEPLQSLLLLAREAFAAGVGQIPDERVRDSGLPRSRLSALGITSAS
jgi:hypothetical protein